METYLINWLKERQAQIPLPLLTLTHIDFKSENYRAIHTTCHFHQWAQEITFIKHTEKVEVIAAQFEYAGERYFIT